MRPEEQAKALRALAQNDYTVDGKRLGTAVDLEQIADDIARRAKLAELGERVLSTLAERSLGIERTNGALSDGLARDGFREIASAARSLGLLDEPKP